MSGFVAVFDCGPPWTFLLIVLNKLLKSKLQVAQNKVIRFINQLRPRERITNEMLSELNLVNVDTRVKQLKLNHVHKLVKKPNVPRL